MNEFNLEINLVPIKLGSQINQELIEKCLLKKIGFIERKKDRSY